MIVLVFGANGQVGRELMRAAGSLGAVVAATRSGFFNGARCEKADLSVPVTLQALLDRIQPELVINAAAYTAVDDAESDFELAHMVNAAAPAEMAAWCAARRKRFVQYSTDYVFDGTSRRAYREDDLATPINVYGVTKLLGEQAVRKIGGKYSIIRTAGVYSRWGRNFVRTMLELARRGDPIRVVDDQVNTPTPASLVADATIRMMRMPDRCLGTWHLTPGGKASWFEFSNFVLKEASAAGLISFSPQVEPVSSCDYVTTARRPAWSVLDNTRVQCDFGMALPEWQEALKQELLLSW